MNGCGAADYMDMTMGTDQDRMIMAQGTMFDMPCMTILAGQSVMFMWDFSKDPLEPGNAPEHATDPPGDSPNPITEQTSGATTSVKFPKAGMFPFHVKGQPMMTGVIHVK